MEREQVENLLRRRPFQAFTIHTDDGDLIGVKSPEFIWLPPVGDTLFVAAEIGDGGSTKLISLPHISQVTVGPDSSIGLPSSQR